MSNLTKKIAGTVFPRYSRLLDEINQNARMQRWMAAETANIPCLKDRKAPLRLAFDRVGGQHPHRLS